MKKQGGAVFASALCFFGSLFSATNEASIVKPNGCEGVVLCSSNSIYKRCDDCRDYGWSVNVGLLYQQPWMTNMGAGAADIGQSIDGDEVPYINTTSVFLEECFNYSLGLTAGIGYFMDHDNWFLSVNFDWLSSNMKNSYNNPGLIYHMAGFLNPLVSDFTSLQSNTWDSLKTEANLDIYDLNFALSRGSFYSKYCSCEPFVGIKALWYNQLYRRRGYNDILPSNSSYVEGLQKSQSWGVGPSFGLSAEYFLVKQLSIFSESSIAILYGGINTQTTSLYFDPSINNEINGVATYIQNFKQPYFIPFRTIIGIKLGRYLFNDKQYVAFKIGYDIRYVIGNSGLSGDPVNASLTGQSYKVPIMLYKSYDIAANGLYVNFIWNF
jgi:hypothetical protein